MMARLQTVANIKKLAANSGKVFKIWVDAQSRGRTVKIIFNDQASLDAFQEAIADQFEIRSPDWKCAITVFIPYGEGNPKHKPVIDINQ